MYLYIYRFLNHSGKLCYRFVWAFNQKIAVQKLRDKGYDAYKVHSIFHFRYISSTQRLQYIYSFSTQLRLLLNGGVPLCEAIHLLKNSFNDPLKEVLFNIECSLKEGSLFAIALQKSYFFPPLYCALISAGEKSGNLGDPLLNISNWLLKTIEFRRQLATALFYPFVSIAFCILILIVMLIFTLPALAEIVSIENLNGVSYILFQVSHFLRNSPGSFLITSALIMTGGYYLLSHRSIKKILSEKWLRISIIQRWEVCRAQCYFFQSLLILLKGGLPFAESLKMAIQSIPSTNLKEKFEEAVKQVHHASPFSSELQKMGCIPDVTIHLIRVAERSGKLEEAVSQLASMFEEELNRYLHHIKMVLPPIILILIGIVVGTLLFSMMDPLTHLQSQFNL